LGIIKLREFDRKFGHTRIHHSLSVQHSGSWPEVENQSDLTYVDNTDERGPQDDLFKFDSGSSDRCAGKGIHIIDGNKSVKTAHRADINEGISTSFCQG